MHVKYLNIATLNMCVISMAITGSSLPFENGGVHRWYVNMGELRLLLFVSQLHMKYI